MQARSSRLDWSLGTQWCFSMGIRNFHHSQEGWPRLLDIRLPCPEQMHQEENLPATSHFRHSVQVNRICILLEVGHQHGLLYLELDDKSKDLCTINTPYGLYHYRVLPLGVVQSPDFCQETMEHVLQGIMDADIYIDDIGCFGKSWEQHLQVLEQVITRLQDNGFSVNPRKCEWAVQETNFLGYWLTPNGLKPWHKKIDTILWLQHPRTIKDLCSFISTVTYYCTMFPKCAHILTPFTALTSQKSGNVAWSAECQHAFDTIKTILSSDVLLRYPDHNKPFHVYTDASDLQLATVIVQDDRPVAFYSCKLNAAQCNYTTMEKELLSVVETLKEFRMMLFGCRELHMWTDHKNLTYTTLNSQRVLCWCLFLEDFHPLFHYIPGKHNLLADTLSRLLTFGRQVPDAAPFKAQSSRSRRPLLRLPPLSSVPTPWPWITLLSLIVLSTYHLLVKFQCLSPSRPAPQHKHKMPSFNRSL